MTAHLPSHLAKLSKLRTDARDRVLERACLIADGCRIPYAEADVLAYQQEATEQRGLPGVES